VAQLSVDKQVQKGAQAPKPPQPNPMLHTLHPLPWPIKKFVPLLSIRPSISNHLSACRTNDQ